VLGSTTKKSLPNVTATLDSQHPSIRDKTLDELKREEVLAGYEKWDGEFVTTDKWIETLYRDRTEKQAEATKSN
jgi:hypothetical protein